MLTRISNVLFNWFLTLTTPLWCIPVIIYIRIIERDFLDFFVKGEDRLRIHLEDEG